MDPTWNILDWINSTEGSWILILIAFTVSQLINVLLSTIKSVILIKGTKLTATITNTISYTINVFIVALIGSVVTNVWLVCIITFITNLIGVYFSLWLIEKFRKDKVWEIKIMVSSSVEINNIAENMKKKNIKLHVSKDYYFYNHVVSIYSRNKNESNYIYNYIKEHNLKEIITNH